MGVGLAAVGALTIRTKVQLAQLQGLLKLCLLEMCLKREDVLVVYCREDTDYYNYFMQFHFQNQKSNPSSVCYCFQMFIIIASFISHQ